MTRPTPLPPVSSAPLRPGVEVASGAAAHHVTCGRRLLERAAVQHFCGPPKSVAVVYHDPVIRHVRPPPTVNHNVQHPCTTVVANIVHHPVTHRRRPQVTHPVIHEPRPHQSPTTSATRHPQSSTTNARVCRATRCPAPDVAHHVGHHHRPPNAGHSADHHARTTRAPAHRNPTHNREPQPHHRDTPRRPRSRAGEQDKPGWAQPNRVWRSSEALFAVRDRRRGWASAGRSSSQAPPWVWWW